MGVIGKPGGRFGPPTTATPGSEKKARSGKSYQSGVSVGFGINSGHSLDKIPVSPKSPVHVGKSGMPNTELGEKSVK